MLHRPIRRVLWTNCYFFHNSIVGLACVGATAYLWKLSQVCLLCMKKKNEIKNAKEHLADFRYRALRSSGTDLLTGGLGTRSSTTRTYVFSILVRICDFFWLTVYIQQLKYITVNPEFWAQRRAQAAAAKNGERAVDAI